MSHPALGELADFRRRRLSPDQTMRLDRHLEACPECRAALELDASVQRARAGLVNALLAGNDEGWTHASYEDLASSVDGKLGASEQKALEGHLEVCETCRQSREDLQALSVAPPRRRPRRPAVWAAVTTSAAAAVLLLTWGIGSRPGSGGPSPSSAASPARAEGIETLPPAVRSVVVAALREGRLERPAALAPLISEPVHLLGGGAPPSRFTLVAPLGTMVREERPTFRWRPLEGADRYEVHVYDADYHEVLASGPLTSPRWTPSHTLARGRTFSWVVSAHRDGERILSPGPPAPEARFGVLGPSDLAVLEKAERAGSASSAVLGALCASVGLLDEAEAQLDGYLKANPNSPQAAELLRRIRAWRPSRGASAWRGPRLTAPGAGP
jgi:hypothetical protein